MSIISLLVRCKSNEKGNKEKKKKIDISL